LATVRAIDTSRDGRLLMVIAGMCLVTAGYPSYVAHPVTLLAPVPLLVMLVLLDDGRLTSLIWIAAVSAMMIWTVLVYLAMAGTATGLIHSLAMYAPFAALAFHITRAERIALVFAVGTTALLCVRVVASFVRAGAQWVPWQVYEGNELSARLNVLLPLVLVAWHTVPGDRRRSRGLLLLLLAAGILSIVLAQERAGLGTLAILLFLGAARTNWRWLIGAGAAALAAWLVASQSIVSVLERVRFVNFVPSHAGRPEIWNVAIDATRRSSWLGVGPGNSGDALRSVGDDHAHNSLVQTTLEAGWLGALLVAGLAVYLIVLATRLFLRGGQDTLWALSLLAYVGFSVISSPIQRPDFTIAVVLVIMVGREHVRTRGDPCAR
jgi:O-antigen ligase